MGYVAPVTSKHCHLKAAGMAHWLPQALYVVGYAAFFSWSLIANPTFHIFPTALASIAWPLFACVRVVALLQR